MMGCLTPIECKTKVIEDQGGLLIAKELDLLDLNTLRRIG